MVLVEPAGAASDTDQNVEPLAPHDSATAHETDPSQHVSATPADFEDAANMFDEPSRQAAPASPDLTETVEDLSIRDESRHEAPENHVGADLANGWKSESVVTDESDDVASSDLSPPPLPVGDEVLLPNADWTSASTVQWRNRILTGIAAVVGVVLALILLVLFSGGDGAPTVASDPTSPGPAASGDGVSGKDEREPEDRVEAMVIDSDPTASATEDEGKDTSSGVLPGDGAADDSSKPPLESTSESPAPDASNPDPAPTVVEPVADDPLTEEPPGLTPKEPTTDSAPPGGEPSPLAATLREFGALLEETDEPASPMPEVETEAPRAPDSDDSEDEPSVRRTGPRVVELDERLNDPVTEIEFDGVPLGDFLRFVSDYSTIPITLNADILRWARVSPLTAVKLKMADTTVDEMLEQGLAPLGFEYRVEADQLFVTRRPKDESGVREVTFKVEDLVGDDMDKLRQLGTRIMDFVEPESWASRGGTGTITFHGTELIIDQYETVQFEILEFCEKLRIARGLPKRGPYDAAMFRLETRGERARKKLAQPITLTYIRPAPLQRIVDRIAETSELHILIDWRALAEAGWSPDAEVRFSVADQPVAKALTTLLEPMDLAYRIVDESTLQVTTPTVVDSRLEVEFYRVLKRDDDGAKLVQSIRDALGSANFRDFGGGGQVAFDEPSNCLLACLSQTRQLELQAWLAAQPDMAASPASAGKTTPTATVESRIVPTSGRASND